MYIYSFVQINSVYIFSYTLCLKARKQYSFLIEISYYSPEIQEQANTRDKAGVNS